MLGSIATGDHGACAGRRAAQAARVRYAKARGCGRVFNGQYAVRVQAAADKHESLPAETGKQGAEVGKHTAMTAEAAARVQSAEAKAHGGEVSSDSFAARAQSAAAKHAARESMPADTGNQGAGGSKSTPMTNEAAARIQSAEAKAHGGQVSKGSFAARAQSAAARNANQGKK